MTTAAWAARDPEVARARALSGGGRLFHLTSLSTGFAVMGGEVAAARLLAPFFGTSTLVWSSLIGVVLGGLAVGGLLGGRWSRRPRALSEASALVGVAGILLLVVPTVTRPVMRLAVDGLHAGGAWLLVGGFVFVLAALVLPVILLGAVSPILMHHAATARAEVGTAAGRLGAWGTLGSLAGTFVCGAIFIPLLGTQTTFSICGGLAVGVGCWGLWAQRARPLGRAALGTAGVVAFGLLHVPVASSIRLGEGRTIATERESPYSHITVVDDAAYRHLYVNEGFATQTTARLDGAAYLRGVWGYYAVAPAFTRKPPERILVVGLGGGTSASDYTRRLPRAEIVAVDLDPVIAEIARTHFRLPASVEVHVDDARTFLAHDPRAYDLVVIDAFQFPYVPFQLATQEFFREVRAHLREGGAVMINVGRKGQDLQVVHAVASTLETVFPHVAGVTVRNATNAILLATSHPLSEAGGAANVTFTPAEQGVLRDLDPFAPWVVPASDRLVLTDDRAPVEWLTNRIVARELLRAFKGSS